MNSWPGKKDNSHKKSSARAVVFKFRLMDEFPDLLSFQKERGHHKYRQTLRNALI